MAEIVITVAADVAAYLVYPIKLQFSYLFKSHHKVKDLLQKIDTLGHARREVEELVEKAKRQGDEISPHVLEWLQATQGILQTSEDLAKDEERASKGCFHLKSRYNLSKRAVKLGDDVEVRLLQARDYGDSVSYRPRPPPLISTVSSTNDAAFPSRQSIFNQIMEALRNDETSIVGVWGMGGVGKTTLALQVAKRAEEENLFDKVVMASSISQNPIISEIQTELARTLSLTFREGEDRAVRLMNSLKNKEKILVIIDDIWDKLDLGEIGIPYGDDHKGCKLLVTSREFEVMAIDMKAQQVFHLPHLEAEEAWSLFKRTAGDFMEFSPELKPIADDIVRECEGLPIAIITIAYALKNKSKGEWKNALRELKMAKPTNVRGISSNVYSCLELSYNHLKGEEEKSLFLLCGLLGGRIFMDHLLVYATGLNLFEGMYSMEEATNKLITLVGKLKASSLLLDAEGKDNDGYRSLFFDDSFVKMHNVVRQVARAIASKAERRQYVVSKAVELQKWDRRGEYRNYIGISLECRGMDELPPRLECPELELFLLNSSFSPSPLGIPEAFFQGVTNLRVLHLSGMSLRPSPASFGFLSNLRTLCLIECKLEHRIIIGEMKKLLVLSLAKSTIVELPKEIMQLQDLRVLDLQDCTELRIIPRNVISSLSRLEYLSLRGCYGIEWGRDGESNNNKACFYEIKNLPLLRTLEVQVSEPSMLPAEDIVLNPVNLTRCSIMIGKKGLTGLANKFSRNLIAGVKIHAVRLKCFSNLLKTCQLVSLEELDGISNVVYDLANENGFPELECLMLYGGDTIRHIVSSSLKWVPPRDTFYRLDQLDLFQLPDLESVFNFDESAHILMESFGELRFLRLRNCEKLRCVFSLPTQHGRKLTFFPRLQKLVLGDLSHLLRFYSTPTPQHSQVPMSIFNQQEAFPALETLEISTLKGVAEIWRGQFSWESFSKLRVLSITNCHGISVVISSNMIEKLYNLEELEVKQCNLVNEVVQKLDPTMGAFTKLKRLELEGLPNLESFCSATSHAFRFPSLEKLTLKHCPKMELFCKGVSGPSYESEDIEDEEAFFPKLTHVQLENLGRLKRFCSQVKCLRCPVLEEVYVRRCDEVGVLFKEIGWEGEVDAQPLFLIEKGSRVSSLKLRVLKITDCHGISVVISSNTIQKLHNLEELEVMKCDSVNEVFHLLDNETTRDVIDFTKLKSLVLDGLPNLRGFCSATSHTFRFPSLVKLRLKHCPKMESFFKGIVLHTPYLKFEGIYDQCTGNS